MGLAEPPQRFGERGSEQGVHRVVIVLERLQPGLIAGGAQPGNHLADAKREVKVDVRADPQRGVRQRRECVIGRQPVGQVPAGGILRQAAQRPVERLKVAGGEHADQHGDELRGAEIPEPSPRRSMTFSVMTAYTAAARCGIEYSLLRRGPGGQEDRRGR